MTRRATQALRAAARATRAARDRARRRARWRAVVALGVGSGGSRTSIRALLGYLGATLVARRSATVWRVSAFWRRPASAFYARALARGAAPAASLCARVARRRRATSRRSDFIAPPLAARAGSRICCCRSARSRASPSRCRWCSAGCTSPPTGRRRYRVVALRALPAVRFARRRRARRGSSSTRSASPRSRSSLGAAYFLALARSRARRLPGRRRRLRTSRRSLLLLVVALTGLALPASRRSPGGFRVAALAARGRASSCCWSRLPFSKLGHVLIRPLQLGARAVRAAGRSAGALRRLRRARSRPPRSSAAVAALLARARLRASARTPTAVPPCRRRQRRRRAGARSSAPHFQPRLSARARAGARPRREEAA